MGRFMRKLAAAVVVGAIVLGGAWAGDFSFLFTELDQHPEILAGFLPTLVTVGASYDGLDLIEGDLTQIQATIGGGYTQRKVYQHPASGAPLAGDFFVFDAGQLRWNLKFLQGLGDSWVPGKDLATLYVGYEGRWEVYLDSMVAGQNRKNGVDSLASPVERLYPVPTFDGWSVGGATLGGSPVLKDLANDRRLLATIFYLGCRLNGMEDTGPSCDGFLGDINLKAAPKGLSGDDISYLSATLNLVASKTLFQTRFANGSNAFSIVAIDRANANWTGGSGVPLYAQGPVSLGRKVRGFNTYSFNTEFSVVNNFDIRLSGPDRIFAFMDGIFPRLNLFVDCGYHWGRYFNSEERGEHFLASAGAQLEMSFFDFIDLGVQVAYTLTPAKNAATPWTNLIIGATFFLDF